MPRPNCRFAKYQVIAIVVIATSATALHAQRAGAPSTSGEATSVVAFDYAPQDKLAEWSVPAFAPDNADTNFSGVAFNPATKTLIIVDNEPNASDKPGAPDQGDLYEYETDGTYRRRIHMRGFSDPEGIAYMGADPERADNDRYVICEERIGRLAIVSVDRSKAESTVDRAAATIIEPKPNPIDDKNDQTNDGFEGITYDPKADVFYLLKENGSTRGVYRVAPDGKCEQLQIDGLFDGVKGVSEPLGDLADIQLHEGCLYVLSEITNRIAVIRLEGQAGKDGLAGRIVGQIPPLGQTLPHKQPEGIALSPDGQDLWIIGEPREAQHWRRGKK